jgi:hypothetical protein
VWDESMWEYEVRPNRNRKRDWSSLELEPGLTKIASAFRSRKRLLRNYQRRFKVCIFFRPASMAARIAREWKFKRRPSAI